MELGNMYVNFTLTKHGSPDTLVVVHAPVLSLAGRGGAFICPTSVLLGG